MDNDSLETGWKWEDGMWTFVDLIKWVLVVYLARKKNEPDRSALMTTPELINAKAKEYGINEYTISKEMVRIGQDVLDMLVGAELERRREMEQCDN